MKSRHKPQRKAPPASAAARPEPRGGILERVRGPITLVALVLVSYAPVVQAGFIWDDDFYVTNNSTLHSLDGLRRMWFELGAVPQYYPLVHTTFWIEQHLWGIDPLGYHIDNVLLHAMSVVLLWRLLGRLEMPGAWLAAALFAVHPVEVESVAWITERKNVLSFVLALASMLCYLRYSPPDRAEANERPATPQAGRWRWYARALVLFVAALLSKTVVATMPAVLLVIFWWRRGRITRREAAELLPFFAAALALGLVTVWMEKHHVGAKGEEWSLTPIDRMLVAGRAAWFYAGKILWPNPLVFFYPRWDIQAARAWQSMFPAAIAGLLGALALGRARLGRGPLAAVLIFLGVLVPALGFFDVYPFRYSFVADHFQYHASAALLTLTAAAAVLLAGRLRTDQMMMARFAATALIGGLAVMTFCQTFVYYNLETLYRHTIEKNPTSWAAYTNLSLYFASLGRDNDAIEPAVRALEIAPERSDMHGNLAALELSEFNRAGSPEKLAAALARFQHAVELDPANYSARKGFGFALVRAQRFDAAAEQFATVLQVWPDDAMALYGRGLVSANRGEFAEAEEDFRAALRRNPGHLDAAQDLGIVLARLGRDEEAAAQFQRVLSLEPQRADAHFELGNVLRKKGELDQALAQYGEAVRLRPGFVEALTNLGTAHLQAGRPDDAIRYLQEALRLRPEFPAARANLEKALEMRNGP